MRLNLLSEEKSVSAGSRIVLGKAMLKTTHRGHHRTGAESDVYDSRVGCSGGVRRPQDRRRHDVDTSTTGHGRRRLQD